MKMGIAALIEMKAERNRLRAINAELVETLEELLQISARWGKPAGGPPPHGKIAGPAFQEGMRAAFHSAANAARAALAKAKTAERGGV